MLAAPRIETIGEPHKILFVNLIEDRRHGLLNDFILQGCDAQGTLPPIGFRNVGSRFLGKAKAALDTFPDGFGYADPPASHRGPSHTLSTSCRRFQARLPASGRKSSPATDRR